MTKKQIAALKYLIFVAKCESELAKRVMAFLIDQSKGLTKEVCVSLVADREGCTADEIHAAALGFHEMVSSGGTTHLDELLALMRSRWIVSHHYGDFDPNRSGDPFNNDGQFAGVSPSQVSHPRLVRTDMPRRYTFWLAKDHCSRTATLVVATREDLEKIDLKRPGLYPSIEQAHTAMASR